MFASGLGLTSRPASQPPANDRSLDLRTGGTQSGRWSEQIRRREPVIRAQIDLLIRTQWPTVRWHRGEVLDGTRRPGPSPGMEVGSASLATRSLRRARRIVHGRRSCAFGDGRPGLRPTQLETEGAVRGAIARRPAARSSLALRCVAMPRRLLRQHRTLGSIARHGLVRHHGAGDAATKSILSLMACAGLARIT